VAAHSLFINPKEVLEDDEIDSLEGRINPQSVFL
jgi:hypothetical protein